MDDFSKPKIVYPNMTKYLPFYYDEEMFYTNQKCFFITTDTPAYLTAFLNSSLFKFCFRDSFPELLGGTRELSKIFFDKIPIMKVNTSIETKFAAIVGALQKHYSIESVLKLDKLIFELYGLTEEEQQVIGYIEIQ